MSKDDDLRRHVIETCLSMNRSGLNQGKAGNVSVRNDEGFLLTGSGIAYESMEPRHVVQMDLQGTYTGDILPSSEWRMHLDIYRHFADAGAVVHVHSPHATAVSCLRREIPPFHYMIGVAGGSTIRCADYARFGSVELSEAMIVALEDRKACLLANHGLICFSVDLRKALELTVEVEALCRQFVLASQCGTPVLLSDEEMQDVLQRFGAYGKQVGEHAPGEKPAFDPPVRREQ